MIDFLKRLQNEIDWGGVFLFVLFVYMPISCSINSCEMICHDEIVSVKEFCSHGAKGTIAKLSDKDVLLCSCK